MTTTRTEHVDWCKKRAYEYVDRGDLANAYASFASDMSKHPETANHAAINIGLHLMMMGQIGTASEMRKFIEGFN